jgi:hypothetical protein
MKKILFLAVVLISCTKPKDNRPPLSTAFPPSISFNYGSATKSYVQIEASSIPNGSRRTCVITGTKNPTTENYFQITLTTDSLKAGAYDVSGHDLVIYREGNVVANNYSKGGLKLQIFSNVGGIVSGSFTGQLGENGSLIDITQGKINSVRIEYK